MAGLRWHDAPSPEVLVFTRAPGFGCVVNFGPDPVPIPLSGRVLVSSIPIAVDGLLPAYAALWLDLDDPAPQLSRHTDERNPSEHD